MKLIVGLGNIGKEYENTRHNVGFLALDSVANHFNITFQKEKFQGLYTEFLYEGEKIILLKPQKYMNLSGEVVKSFIEFFKIDISDILIISDDLDMPVGKIKLKYKGSSGGHNGLKNIEAHIKTSIYKRLKIGISNNKEIETKDYVLGKIPKSDMNQLQPIFDQMPDIVKDFITLEFDNLMNKYNRK